jgi:hypothetical protein
MFDIGASPNLLFFKINGGLLRMTTKPCSDFQEALRVATQKGFALRCEASSLGRLDGLWPLAWTPAFGSLAIL